MSKELIESIIQRDFVSANKLFSEQIDIIKQKKLYEEKRQVAANLQELGPFDYKQRQKELKLAGAPKASEFYAQKEKEKAEKKQTASLRKTFNVKKKEQSTSGNSPHAMIARMRQKASDALSNYDAEQAKKTAMQKSVGGKILRGAGKVGGFVLRDVLASIG